MSETTRNVAIAIGVANKRPLKHLGGAVNGAKAFFGWASALGYETKLIVDKPDDVTLARLGEEIETVLTRKDVPPIHRFVIFFAGHGLIREADDALWLLSDWQKGRAVSVNLLRRRLYRYNIKQVAIFGDACRSLPADIDTADLAGDPVISQGPNDRIEPAIDRFIAAQDGTATYMIPGDDPKDDRCIFSGILLEGLWGTKPLAFARARADKVTSQSLGAYLKSEVPELAKRYQFKLDPSASWSFPEGDDVYFFNGATTKAAPTFPEWPTLEAWQRIAQGAAQDENASAQRDRDDGYFVPESGGASLEFSRGGLPNFHEKMAEKSLRHRRRPSRKAAAPSLIKRFRDVSPPTSFETGAGFATYGMPVRTIWSATGVTSEQGKKPEWWRIGSDGKRLDSPASVLIEYTDGLFAAVTALPDFIATLLRDEIGVSALVYRKIGAPPSDSEVAEKSISEMEKGSLRVDTATNFAISLRKSKHADPVLGVISGYLYDSIGDAGSIRSMAYYYVDNKQPIPYDLALLGHLQGTQEGQILRADVPRVKKRAPRTAAEEKFSWAYSETPAVSGVVGGLWPWMRQGWALLDEPAPMVLPRMIGFAKFLTKARFSTLTALGGRGLAELIELEPGNR